jgi:hypothetical protein
MTDARIVGEAEPARDPELAALLAGVVGFPPAADVDWTALATRIGSARARQRAAWWSYAARWERRAIPVALAAGLAGVLALWGLGMPLPARGTMTTASTDPIAAIVDGTPVADVARTFARSVTTPGDPAQAELY